jgi:chromosome segregation ATPase
MAPLLKSLLGNGSKERQLSDEMRAVLQEMKQERGHYETLVKSARTSVDRLQQLGEPISKAGTDMDALTARLTGLEQVVARLEALDERAAALEQSQQQAETRIEHATDDAQRTRSLLDELNHKVDMALGLEQRLEKFLEMEAPLEGLRRDADTLRAGMDGMSEQLGRLREQHDRVMDAHKAALSKMEVFDQRHGELSRAVEDKEQRVAGVEQVLRGADEVREKVDDAMRRL